MRVVPIDRYGDLLLEIRTTAGLSRREVARRAGFSPDTARRCEQGEMNVRMDKILRYGAACGRPVEYRFIDKKSDEAR